MKRSLLTLVVAALALTFTVDGYSYIQEAKKEIKVEELPKAVKEAASSSEYASWTMGKIHEVDSKTAVGTKEYEIEMKDGAGTSVILVFDKAGQLVATKDKK